MFKNLREKINVSDSNSRNKKNSNTNPDDDDTEGYKIPVEQNLSRFSSISSLVSDVGSVFSKGLSIPQITNKNSRQFGDTESMSEYDDSVVQGTVLNKEELFLKYQRAQSLAKRYKTRSLEVVECYKKLELENTKLIQTLTDSQDCNIRRVGELREENELTTKAKNDVEENYRLMIDEDRELINVLRLQISLLKEGKDLPVELESQIKERHGKEVQIQKDKDEEMRELKSNISHYVDSLQLCEEQITSLHSQLTEMQTKYDNVSKASEFSYSHNEQLNTDLTNQRSQHAAALENIQKEHSERIKIMLFEFDEKTAQAELDIHEEHNQRVTALEQEMSDLKDKLHRLSQDNERLEEQVSIKTKIIDEIISRQDLESIKSKERHSIIIDQSSSYEMSTPSFSQEYSNEEKREDVVDLKDEIKFLLSRIEQMETLKSQTEEETSKTEEELKMVETKLKNEREDCDMKCKSYELKLDQMRTELQLANSRTDELGVELSNLHTMLSNKSAEIETLRQDHRDADEKYRTLDAESKKVRDEKLELSLRFEKATKDLEEIEHQIQSIQADYGNDRTRFTEQCARYTTIQDKYDELNSRLEKEICEKNKLSALLNYNEKNIGNTVIDEDSLGLKIVEMRQRYDHQIEEGRDQVNGLETAINDRNLRIGELELELRRLSSEKEETETNLVAVQTLKEEMSTELNKMRDEVSNYAVIIEDMEKEMSREKEGHENMIKENLTLELERVRLDERCSLFIEEKERLEKECFDKDEQIRSLSDDKMLVAQRSEEMNTRMVKLDEINEECSREMIAISSRILLLEQAESDLKEANDENVKKHVETIDNLNRKISIFGKYFNIFQQWTEDCDDRRGVYWTSALEEGCEAIGEIASTGRCIERILLSNRNKKEESLKKVSDESNRVKQMLTDFCSTSEDCDKELNEEDVVRRLSDIREEMDKKDRQLMELDEYSDLLDQVLASDDVVDDVCGITATCTLDESRKRSLVGVTNLRKRLQSTESEISGLLKKIDTNNHNKIQHFNGLVSMFELTEVDCEQKTFCNDVMQALSARATRHVSALAELKETAASLQKSEQQRNTVVEECKSKNADLVELRESLDCARQELDRLKVMVRERDTIEEELRASKREVGELTEKILNMNTNFDMQKDKRQELEKKFITMLEKIKANHISLAESYVKEKDYQEQLNGEHLANSEEMLVDDQSCNLMLKEVLQLSQKLLVLNNVYKECLERSRAETKEVTDCWRQSELKCANMDTVLGKLTEENAGLCGNVEELRKTYDDAVKEQSRLTMELDRVIGDKDRSVETVLQLRSASQNTDAERSRCVEEIHKLEERNEATERRLVTSQQSLDKMTHDYHELSDKIRNLTDMLDEERRTQGRLLGEIGEKNVAIKSYETKIDSIKTELKNVNEEHEIEIFEIKQQFSEEKTAIDDDHNRRVKKLAKDFNEKVLEKEQDFQKTFQDALENVRNDEGRLRADLKYQIEQLNRIIIELETEKNSLLNTISDGEQSLKKAETSLHSNETQLQSLHDEISSYQYKISDMEVQMLKAKTLVDSVEQRSKINQTVNTHSFYDDLSPDTDSANDHDILKMHCTDLEDQVRQLHVENISLKETVSSNPLSSQERIYGNKSRPLTNQSSLDNVSVKSSNLLNSTFHRSPNTSCSEYQFCPYPITEATEYEYLRDILVKYMSGLETDTLARVLCTVMKFSRDETERIVRFELDKKKAIHIQLFPR